MVHTAGLMETASFCTSGKHCCTLLISKITLQFDPGTGARTLDVFLDIFSHYAALLPCVESLYKFTDMLIPRSLSFLVVDCDYRFISE